MLHDRRGAAGHRADVRVGVGSADDRALPAARFGAARQNPEPEPPATPSRRARLGANPDPVAIRT